MEESKRAIAGDPRLGPSPRHHYQPQGTIPLPHLRMYLYMASCKLILFSKPMRLREGAIYSKLVKLLSVCIINMFVLSFFSFLLLSFFLVLNYASDFSWHVIMHSNVVYMSSFVVLKPDP